jgi:hypothetical protein
MHTKHLSPLIILLLLSALLGSCSSPSSCPVTEPEWVLPPKDSAVGSPPTYGYYFVNEDRSIWASAWWYNLDENYLIPGEGLKNGWFRPAGEMLEITGRRLDGDAPEFEASVPCCYPTRFQATGLTFPTTGCWEVTAHAGESMLTFVVEVDP